MGAAQHTQQFPPEEHKKIPVPHNGGKRASVATTNRNEYANPGGRYGGMTGNSLNHSLDDGN